MKTKFVLFDFDGVIADSFGAAFETVQTMCPAITPADYQKRFEGNIYEVAHGETFHNESCKHDLNWFDIYIPKLRGKTTVFPGMKEVVHALEKEYVLVIISSTLTFPIEEFLRANNLETHFDWVLGSDVHKSKTEKMNMVFEKYHISGSDCVFITDTLGDIREAEKTHIPSIAVTWGFHMEETLAKGKPYALVHMPEELAAAVASHFSGKH